MEPVSTAIIAAIAAGLVAGVKDTGKKAVADAYNGLKALITRKFGGDSKLAEAVVKLEEDPKSPGRAQTVGKKVREVGADQDQEIVDAANLLLDKLKELPSGEAHIQFAVGSNIAQADRGSTATVTVNEKE